MINRNNKKTLLCCLRIQSAGLLIGLVDLFSYLILLLALCTALTRPSIYDYYLKQLSKEYIAQQETSLEQQPSSHGSIKLIPLSTNNDIDINNGVSSSNDFFFLNNNIHISNNKQDRAIAFMVTMGSVFITIMYVYGIFKNKGNYMLPYFCLKVFHVVIAILTTLGFYSCLPNVKLWIKMHTNFPYKEELLNMDKQSLELLMFASLLAISLFKVYIVIIIWNCYRYIVSRSLTRNDLLPTTTPAVAVASPPTIAGDIITLYKTDDERFLTSASLLPPKYDEVIKQQQQQQQNVDNNNATTSSSNIDSIDATSSQPPPYIECNSNVAKASNENNGV